MIPAVSNETRNIAKRKGHRIVLSFKDQHRTYRVYGKPLPKSNSRRQSTISTVGELLLLIAFVGMTAAFNGLLLWSSISQ
jgi:hypothetical protein